MREERKFIQYFFIWQIACIIQIAYSWNMNHVTSSHALGPLIYIRPPSNRFYIKNYIKKNQLQSIFLNSTKVLENCIKNIVAIYNEKGEEWQFVKKNYLEFCLFKWFRRENKDRSYRLDFKNGFKYKWNALLSFALFSGDFCASAYKRSYTLPSYAPKNKKT